MNYENKKNFNETIDTLKKFLVNGNKNDYDFLIKEFQNNRCLLINTDLSEENILSFLKKNFSNYNLKFLNVINKKVLNSESLEDINILLINNRTIFNKNTKFKIVFKSDNVSNENFEFYLENNINESEKIILEITKTRYVLFNTNIKVIFINHLLSPPLFSKKTLEKLVHSEKLSIINIKEIESTDNLFFYSEKELKIN